MKPGQRQWETGKTWEEYSISIVVFSSSIPQNHETVVAGLDEDSLEKLKRPETQVALVVLSQGLYQNHPLCGVLDPPRDFCFRASHAGVGLLTKVFGLS